jgi:predicted MPP superfamily phosphohydrolase
MRKSRFWWVIILLMLVMDFYVFQALQVVTAGSPVVIKIIVYVIYWLISVAAIAIFWGLPYMRSKFLSRLAGTNLFSIMMGLVFAKLVASLFFLGNDIYRLVNFIGGDPIPRSYEVSWAGIIAGGALFAILIYGFNNKYRYQVKRIKLHYPNLPAAFTGLKIVHISDIHSGSLTNKQAVIKGVHKILKEEPDLILFTGDLVNNVADEMNDYIEVFNQLQAPMGVYSTLGNHDYGDYVHWPSAGEKAANLERLKQVHHVMGWRLLMNEHVVLEKEGEKIAVMGIENWSAKARFPKYGSLRKAHEGTEPYPFKILLSHDPSHWKGEVLKDFPDIDLMLAGHTHGMQFGLEMPLLKFKWSPVQYVYREWAGLYEMNEQRLYVNRGFGFLGYPGRSGIMPEITVLELNS